MIKFNRNIDEVRSLIEMGYDFMECPYDYYLIDEATSDMLYVMNGGESQVYIICRNDFEDIHIVENIIGYKLIGGGILVRYSSNHKERVYNYKHICFTDESGLFP